MKPAHSFRLAAVRGVIRQGRSWGGAPSRISSLCCWSPNRPTGPVFVAEAAAPGAFQFLDDGGDDAAKLAPSVVSIAAHGFPMPWSMQHDAPNPPARCADV